jgi:CDP-2,3-bis-(O-geranylgeranyl)-sn-glycerol synthase
MEQHALCWICIGKALLLLMLVNGAPIISRNFLKTGLNRLRSVRWPIQTESRHKVDYIQILTTIADCPVDLGYCWFDQRPVFGTTKTWRGLFFAVLTGSITAPWLGLDWQDGALFAGYSMLGDLLSSFIKRRAGYPESSCFRGIDTIPEALFPVLFLQTTLSLSVLDILGVVWLFSLLEALLSPILYWLHIRKRPY